MAELIAVSQELLADIDTPVSAYMKLCQDEPESFLFESGETVESIGRFSIVAWDPLCSLQLGPKGVELDLGGQKSFHSRISASITAIVAVGIL